MKKTKTKTSHPRATASQPAKKNSAPKRPAASKMHPAKAATHPAKAAASARGDVRYKAIPKPPAPPPPPVIKRKPTAEEIAHQHSLERFENALDLFSHNQLGRARGIFERLTDDPARELAERARVYLSICEQRLSHSQPQLKTAEDHYNYAVGLANQGDADEAEEHLLKALKLAPKADYIYYALATIYALRNEVDGALDNLLKAIELNERNRYQAQNDADFTNLLEDPRFTELLYPEKPMN